MERGEQGNKEGGGFEQKWKGYEGGMGVKGGKSVKGEALRANGRKGKREMLHMGSRMVTQISERGT